ncbi:hypothetical protein EJ08DRAFT_644960 [Tothia fuscella]|uniref:Uncharacterized protein n=1 Tax=Tothia fuscella TaxID=1048955 RepID=A0A9P4P3L9_9PEZI|nr:hypothetical protein EJ08DRAFT_644960 [Tothia fuscella]
MWEKAAFLSFFVNLCLAQRAAIADIRERQTGNIPTPSFPPVVIDGLPANLAESLESLVQTLDPATTQTLVVMDLVPKAALPQQFTPGVDSLAPNVFTSVLFPDVPTAAPTGVVVPIVYTYTGTFEPSLVPSGFSFVAPTLASTASIASGFSTVISVPTNRPSFSPSMPFSSMMTTIPSSRPTSSTTSSRSSTTSSTSSTSSTTSTTSSQSSTSSTSNTSSSQTAAPTNDQSKATDPPHPTTPLSGRAIAGIVAGVLCGFILFAALVVFLLQRRKAHPAPDNQVYPEEAYLYDPPITPPPGAGAPSDVEMAHSGSPAERDGLLTGAAMGVGGMGAAGAAGAAARDRRNRGVTLADPGPMAGPSRWDGYSPVESRDVTDGARDPFSDPALEYQREIGQAPNSNRWPLNPQAESGLGSPPQSSAGPSSAAGPLNFAGGPSNYAAGPSDYAAGPSNHAAGPSSSGGAGVVSPQMREVRRAWGWDH